MTDTLKLKALMVEKQYSQKKLCKELGISLQSLFLKIHNKREFKVSEVLKIQTLFNLSNEKRDEIFFNLNVEARETKV